MSRDPQQNIEFTRVSQGYLARPRSGDGLHGRLWGVARGVMGRGILKFLRFGALNLFSTDDSDTEGWS
jgi:hypothetical protein